MNHIFARNFLISTILWIIFVVLADGLERLLLISIFLAIPLLLFLVPTIKRDGSDSRYHDFLMGYHPYVACTIGLAFLFPAGHLTSGILSIPWAIYLLALAGYGIRRMLERGPYILEENAIDIGLIYSFIGGAALSAYCFGGSLLGYRGEILLLTASHFHFAAVFSPLFIGLVGRELCPGSKLGRLYRWTTICLMASPLFVAVGIYTNHIVETIAVFLYSICLFVYSYYVLIHISKKATRLIVRLALQASAVIVVLTILLSVTFSISTLLGHHWLTMDQMKVYHGAANAIGFVLLGLFGWVYLKPSENAVLYGLPQTNINGENKIGKNFLDRKKLADPTQQYAGLVDNLEKFARSDFFPSQVHPKIRSFYENTMLYDLAAQITWHRGFRLLAKIHKAWSKKTQQINLPTNQEEVIQIDSQIMAVCNEKQYWNKNLRAWVRTYKGTDQTMFVAIYSDHYHDNEQYLHITLPIPKRNLTGILRLEHGADLSLQITSLPRRGRKGDEGIYLMIKNYSFRLPLNEHFLIWVDEYGRLQATHRMWLFGFKLVTVEYEISGKVNS
ncbi:YndJ family protein [Shimazuella sp. AN120528]|uniref:YndJ family protein n=1 Tax=Shimazuella soli TaxID=1892854 RepID=UPI001F103D4E|nr:YndJ family protein [Shimazuella soli]MCH5584379.1 YndJ family protein [Shimazuella soli]